MLPTPENRYIPEKLLLLLVMLTIGLLLFRGPLLETRLTIDSANDIYRVALDSDVQDGGNTETEWLDRDQLRWRCELGSAYAYPFCAMQIYFSDSYLNGIDLSNYSHFNMTLDYEGEADSFRVFLRNSHPAYTKPDEIRSTKFNMVEMATRNGSRYHEIKLAYFRVADWWLQLYELDIEHSETDFSNIGLIEIQTGTGLTSGTHRFQLHKLELVGARIGVESFYFGIIVTWIFAILLYLALRIRALNLAVRTGKARQAELTEINTLLDQRSRTLETKIKMDPLTGAYNRAGIEGPLTNAFRNWKYKRLPLSLLLLDVDFFKVVNDTHGHAVGDDVLRELTSLVSKNIRVGDHFARWGGEEFIIVCDDTMLPQAQELGEKLRKLVGEHEFSHQQRVTISTGVAQIRKGENLEALFERTDKALYRAKAEGRNRVVAATQ